MNLSIYRNSDANDSKETSDILALINVWYKFGRTNSCYECNCIATAGLDQYKNRMLLGAFQKIVSKSVYYLRHIDKFIWPKIKGYTYMTVLDEIR
jgi:hypothetical protein